MIDNIKTFGTLAATRLRESVEDVEAFRTFISVLIENDALDVEFSSAPDTLVHEQGMASFTILVDDEELRFSLIIITSDSSTTLSYDPFYVDLSYLTDVTVTALTRDDTLHVLDSVAGLYVDPIRPFSWLVDEMFFDKNTTIEQAKTIFLDAIKAYFLLHNTSIQPTMTLVIDNTQGTK